YGSHQAVSGLTLSIERGEAVALLGPNGSGKTTTLKAAAGVIRPAPRAGPGGGPGPAPRRPAGRPASPYPPHHVPVPEAPTGREVVEFYRSLRRVDVARVDEVFRFASLNGASHRPVGTYSGGMVQRLGLAVAVLPNAPTLLLDEPTAALDPDGLCAFYGLVER